MMLKTKSCLAILTLLCLTDSVLVAHAQTYTPSNRIPVADSTLGTQVTGTGNNFNITGGLVKGQTLFHSFSDLSVPTNGRVDFTNPAGNRDIITRVTGASFSDINGILNTSGANFFLINPNGIVFGTGAQLNVGKAFVGSTASSLDLVAGNGSTITFGTNPSGDAPLLSVAPNVMFDVSRLNLGGGTGAISNFGTLKTQDNNLYTGDPSIDLNRTNRPIGIVRPYDVRVQTNNPNQYIGLIGGNITFDGGKIDAPGARVELGGLSAPGTVTLGTDGNNFRAQFPTNVPRADVSLSNRSNVNVVGAGGGDLAITARNLNLSGNSAISGGIDRRWAVNLGSGSGNIQIDATNNISLDNSQISIDNTNTIAIPVLLRNVVTAGGDIKIAARNLSLTNGARLENLGNGGRLRLIRGNPGNIYINAIDSISLDGNLTKIGTTDRIFDNGGDVKIATGNLTLTNGASIGQSLSNSGVYYQQSPTKIDITATNRIALDGKGSNITASPPQQGNFYASGLLNLTTRQLSLTNGAALLNQTNESTSVNSAGNINITATEDIFLSNSTISTEGGSSSNNDRNSTVGVNLSTQNLTLANNARITSTKTVASNASATAGNINIDATGKVAIDNSIIDNQIPLGSSGTGGKIRITAQDFSLTNGGKLAVSSLSTGSGGSIDLNSQKINLNNGSIVSSSASANGGNISIVSTDYLLLNNNSSISTNSGSTTIGGNGGNITISSPLIIAALGNNDITANAYRGNGGRVEITSQGLFGIEYRAIGSNFTNDITASSTFGQSGAVKVSTPGTDPGKDSTELPKVPTDATKQISQSCGGSNRQNKLTVTGRGGLPANANDLLTADVLWQDPAVADTQKVASNVPTTQNLAPPAVGFVFDGKGRVTLVAAGTSGQPTGTKISCPPEVN
jgi:filamentous hemagglutinin family protein